MNSIKQSQTQIKISQPILIPIANTTANATATATTNVNQYSLKKNCFNPNKGSPPNSWNFRLMQRISDEVPVKSL
jgi:hypothetical protein